MSADLNQPIARGAGIAIAAALSGAVGASAEQAPDLAKYDCMRLDDGKTARGEELIAEGYQIASQGRFGQPNVMLVEPKSSRRANCFVRPEGQR